MIIKAGAQQLLNVSKGPICLCLYATKSLKLCVGQRRSSNGTWKLNLSCLVKTLLFRITISGYLKTQANIT